MAFTEKLGYAVVGVGSDGLSIDWSDTVAALERMDPKKTRSLVRRVLREAGKVIELPVKQELKSLYPGGKKYPRDPNRKSGYFKGQKRKPLYRYARVYVYKNAHGVCVSIYPNRKRKRDIGDLLAEWLDAGTNERGSLRTTYKSRGIRGHKTKKRYFTNYNGPYRGRLSPANYFKPVANDALERAATHAEEAFQRNLVEQFNRK